MILAVGSLAVMGATLGTLLGAAAKFLAVEENPLEVELLSMLPGSNCAQCGHVGCGQAAAALARGEAKPNLCPPGGKAVAEALAKKLGVTVEAGDHEEHVPSFAFIDETNCIGCLRCIQECSSDAIVGASKQMHTVITEFCHGCTKCTQVCPTETISMRPIVPTVATWHWNNPSAGTHAH